MRNNWPTSEELRQLQQEEYDRAEKFDDEADPICECGEPGYNCSCEEIAHNVGHWSNGEPYDYNDVDYENSWEFDNYDDFMEECRRLNLSDVLCKDED